MGAVIQGLSPLDPAQIVQLTVADMRAMSIQELVALSFQLGIDVAKVQVERGKLLTEIMKHAT